MGQLMNADQISSNTARHQSLDISPEALADILKIVEALKEAGYNPYNQLTEYVQTGDECYITRHGNARDLIKELNVKDIKTFLKYE